MRHSGDETFGSGSPPELRLRSALSTYVVFMVIFGVLICFSVLAGLRAPSGVHAVWQSIVLWCVILAAFMVYYALLEVTVCQGVLRYRSLFRERNIRLADIARSQIRWNIGGRDPRPFLVMTSASGDEVLKLNLKPFRAEEIQRLLAVPELKYQKVDDVA
jgi:hypothetical protein